MMTFIAQSVACHCVTIAHVISNANICDATIGNSLNIEKGKIMKRNEFTDEASIRRLKPGVYYHHSTKSGDRLAVRVSPKKKRTFVFYYYAEGKAKKFTLGVFPAMRLKQAIEKVKELSGTDPVREKKQRKLDAEAAERARKAAEKAEELRKLSHRTMTDVWEVYQSKKRFKQKASSTRKEEERKWNIDIAPTLGDVCIKDVTAERLDNLLENKARKSPVAANRLYSFLNLMISPALTKGWITIHPLQHVDMPSREKPRDRVLSDDELRAIWPHLKTTKGNSGDILKLIILSAQRPGEISSMKWADIDMENRLWTQSHNKTGVPMLVPLSDQAMEILEGRERTDEYVFYSRAGVHTTCTSRARSRIAEASGVKDWSAHDMRRTARTIMSRLRIEHHVRERVLNHKQSGMAGVYDQYDYLKEKTDALRKLGNEIWKILGKDIEPGVVIPIRARR